MAHHNQEITPVDATTLPKRKRGRPRKYDYDNLSFEQRRPLQQKTFPNEANSVVGFGLGLQDLSSKANPTSISSLAFQASQAYPIPANDGFCSSITLQSHAGLTNPSSSPIYGEQRLRAEVGSTVSSSCGTQSTSGANPSACLGYKSKLVPSLAHPVGSSSINSQVKPTQASSVSISSHGPTALLGQAVSGTLDGTFDAGYLLTVQVGNTGHVLKGLVFDPRLCVPISAQNDIAPLISPVAGPNGTPSNSIKAQSQTLVSVPIHPAPVSFGTTCKTLNHTPVASRPPQLSTNEVATKDTDPLLSTKKVEPNDSGSGHGIPPALQAGIQDKIPQILLKSSFTDANQESPPAAPLQLVDNNTKAEDLLGPLSKKSQLSLDGTSVDQSTHAIGLLGGDQSFLQVKESSNIIFEEISASKEIHHTDQLSVNMDDAPRDHDQSTIMFDELNANKEVHRTEESSGNMVNAPRDQEQHCYEGILQGQVQQFNDPTTDQKKSSTEPRAEVGEQNLVAPVLPQESIFMRTEG